MKNEDEFGMERSGSRPRRLLTDSVSSDEPETERLLRSQPPPSIMLAGCRRESLTAPPSPTDFRKKRDHRHHNYKNHLHHLIHWRDRWSGEPNKAHEVVVKR
ncbi:hypothetical protein RR48_14585 [Papilio machaon]|uniref:Uncharacterized protein n=1 Tax=Papilio machaon TaxID=76193 RepID=A0A194QKQ5_PAPMA|nr:hypothetical protein RR48_14585 [Papilio machaon]